MRNSGNQGDLTKNFFDQAHAVEWDEVPHSFEMEGVYKSS